MRRAAAIPGRAGRKGLVTAYEGSAGWLALGFGESLIGPLGLLVSFSRQPHDIHAPFGGKSFSVLLDTRAKKYGGPGAAHGKPREGDFLLPGPGALAGKLGV
jgi:hypothetical protein